MSLLTMKRWGVALGVLVALRAGAAPTVRGDLGRKLDDYLTRLEAFGFSGAVLVAAKGEIALEKGYGYANREKRIPFTEDTVSSIGSVTKSAIEEVVELDRLQSRRRSAFLPVLVLFTDQTRGRRSPWSR